MMPVTFYVDPGIVTDIEAKRVHSITLSYTFYETELPVEQASLEIQNLPREHDAPAGENQGTQVN